MELIQGSIITAVHSQPEALIPHFSIAFIVYTGIWTRYRDLISRWPETEIIWKPVRGCGTVYWSEVGSRIRDVTVSIRNRSGSCGSLGAGWRICQRFGSKSWIPISMTFSKVIESLDLCQNSTTLDMWCCPILCGAFWIHIVVWVHWVIDATSVCYDRTGVHMAANTSSCGIQTFILLWTVSRLNRIWMLRWILSCCVPM